MTAASVYLDYPRADSIIYLEVKQLPRAFTNGCSMYINNTSIFGKYFQCVDGCQL